jgi:Transposase DDE domain group 1
VRLQLFLLAYNLGNFLRQAELHRAVRHWKLTMLREKLIKIGAKVVRHSGKIVFQMAEVTVPRELFRAILEGVGGAEITHSGNRMKQKVKGLARKQWKPRKRYLQMGWKSLWKSEKVNEPPLLSEKKLRTDWINVLANLWCRQKIQKKAHAGCGQETKWEIPI